MNMRIRARIYISVFLALFCLSSYAQEDKSVQSRLIDAVASFNSRDYKSAKAALTEIVAEDPANDAACYYLGLSDFYLRDVDEAEMFLRKAVEMDSLNFWYRDRLAAFYSAIGKPDNTIEIYEGLLKDFPKKTEIYYNLVSLYAQKNDNAKVASTLENIITVFGKTPQILTMMGDAQMSEYKDSLALKYYEEALSFEDSYTPALMGKAEILRIKRSYPEYFRTIGQFMSSPEAQPEAKAQYITNLYQRSDPNFIKKFSFQIDSLVEKCVACHPEDTSALRLAGTYYYSTGRPDKSRDYVKKNRDLHPDVLSARALYVQLLSLTEDWETMITESDDAFRQFPDEMAFMEYKNMAYYNLEDYRKVIEVSEEIIRLAPSDSAAVLSAYSSIGDMYHQLGESKKAYAAYDKAMKINPEYAPVLNNYAYYLSCEGRKLKKAYAMSKITVDQEPDNSTYLDTLGWILYLLGKPQEAKPLFKHAMLYGGKESATVMEHYAAVLRALNENDLAKVYENLARNKGAE